MDKILIAIDGPAGAGKSSTAKAVAKRLGLPYLDTGALYRAAAWQVRHKGIDPKNSSAVARMIEKTDFIFLEDESGTRIWINDKEITNELRSPELSKFVTDVCEVSEVRTNLVALQRKWAMRGMGVMEGRDIGTVVIPDAGLKIFMTARPEIRALRRGRELNIADDPSALAKLSEDIRVRDARDAGRDDSPMRPAEDAVMLDTSDLTFDEQVDKIIRLASERFNIKVYGTNIWH